MAAPGQRQSQDRDYYEFGHGLTVVVTPVGGFGTGGGGGGGAGTSALASLEFALSTGLVSAGEQVVQGGRTLRTTKKYITPGPPGVPPESGKVVKFVGLTGVLFSFVYPEPEVVDW